ncbi:MAG: rRNA maturation RNase YbeY, partial [Pseudomonadota bacterium]
EGRPGALSLCLVDRDTIRDMNLRYRGKDAPTNVLSFPQDVTDEAGRALHGDVLLCPEVIAREASDQGKPIEHHYLHLVVHGVLHLLGYDHIEPADADAMEVRERALLARFDIPDPYRDTHDCAMTSEYRTA